MHSLKAKDTVCMMCKWDLECVSIGIYDVITVPADCDGIQIIVSGTDDLSCSGLLVCLSVCLCLPLTHPHPCCSFESFNLEMMSGEPPLPLLLPSFIAENGHTQPASPQVTKLPSVLSMIHEVSPSLLTFRNFTFPKMYFSSISFFLNNFIHFVLFSLPKENLLIYAQPSFISPFHFFLSSTTSALFQTSVELVQLYYYYRLHILMQN